MGDFKMKGPGLYPGYKKLNVARDYKTAKDGRANSSPLQQTADKKSIEDLIAEGFTPADARKMQKDGATTGETKNNVKESNDKVETLKQSLAIKKNEKESGSGINYGTKAPPAKFLKGLVGGIKNIASGQGALGFLNPVAKAARIIGGEKVQGAIDGVVDNPASVLARNPAMGGEAAMMQKYSPTPQSESEYGRRHDRLRKKGHEIQAKAMDEFDAGNTKKSDRLDKRAARKFNKASKIRNK
tara:strand:+ start:3066 stop:3791 length:726 start_codon:yes stop_codon:yes gene_type:complete